MGISGAIFSSLSGLRATQAGLEVVSNNIANANTPGYSRRVINLQQASAGASTIGVRVTGVSRELDLQVQAQLRGSLSSLEYAGVTADAMTRLNALYGGPQDPSALSNVYSQFLSTLEALSTTPESTTLRAEAVAAAQGLASRLNGMSNDIQLLRQEAESAIGTAVGEVNDLLQRISVLDKQIISNSAASETPAGLLDQRDQAIETLSKYMDIRVEQQAFGAVSIHTANGTLLYDDVPVKLSFDEAGTVGANDSWAPNSAASDLGSVRVVSSTGRQVDLFADGSFRSGGILALKNLRDDVLVDAQAQLDEIAAAMARAISEVSRPSTAAGTGRAVDVTGLSEGNSVTMQLTLDGVTRTFTLVDAPPGTVLGDGFTSATGDTVLAIDFSDTAGLAAAVQAAVAGADADFGAAFDFAFAGGQFSVTPDDPGAAVAGLSARATVTGTQDGVAQLPLFVDAGNAPFTGLAGGADQTSGFAARIRVNSLVTADPALIANYAGTTGAADGLRPRAIIDALSGTATTFSPDVGIGSSSAPFKGTISQFLNQIVATQGAAYTTSQRVYEGQEIVTNNLGERLKESSAVSIDQEFARLIELQTSYQANARLISVAQEMIDALMRI
jgi:flagellar hook-associated protein 1 FlgK